MVRPKTPRVPRISRDSLEVGNKVAGIVVWRARSHPAVGVDIGLEDPAYMEVIWMNDEDKDCPVGSRIEAKIRSLDRRVVTIEQWPHSDFVRSVGAENLKRKEHRSIFRSKWWQFWRLDFRSRAEPMNDEFNLQRFVDAQETVYQTVQHELSQGAKRSHWMWFVFPQLRGLGSSPTAVEFGISGLAEARAYLAHPVLGARLHECVDILLRHGESSLGQIFGYPDDMKFRSSMTLFSAASDGESLFDDALEKYCAGQADPNTLRLLNRQD